MRKVILASLLLAMTVSAGDKSFSYLFSRGDNTTIGGNIDVGRIEEIVDRFDGDFLWAKRDGRQYLIRDAATLAEARAAFAQAEVLHAEYERISAKMRPLAQREEQLEDQIDDLEDDGKDASDLRKQLRPITQQLRALEEEEERVDEKEEKLVEAAEAKLREIVDRAIRRGIAERLK